MTGEKEKIKEALLEKAYFSATNAVSNLFLKTANVDVARAFDFDGIIATLSAYVWADRRSMIAAKYPATWRESIKERFFCEWMKKRWPVKYTIVTANFDVMYPNFQPGIPGEQAVVHTHIRTFPGLHDQV